MRRSVLKIICIVSGILFVMFSIFAIFAIARAIDTARGMSIIGGAGASTILFLLRSETPVFYAAIAALFLFVGTGLALIFCKKPKN